MIKVLKFGGTSVGSAANMRRVADIILDQGGRFAVLSAMSGTTDILQGICDMATKGMGLGSIDPLIRELEGKYGRCVSELLTGSRPEGESRVRETMDVIRNEVRNYRGSVSQRIVVAQGELLTTAIFTMYLCERRYRAVLLPAPSFLRGEGAGKVDTAWLKSAVCDMDESTLYITQGFICSDEDGRLSNFGRGGSDYSAALIGAAVGADEVQIWTDIDGMHNNDPRYVENTFPLRKMHFDEAEELAYFGAKILHPSTIQPCKERGIPVLVKNTMDPGAPGTVICSEEETGLVYRAVAAKDNITVVRIYSTHMLMAYGFLRKVFEVFEKYRTPIDMITTSEVSVSLTIDSDCRLPEIAAELKEFCCIEIEGGNSIICIAGSLDHGERGRVGIIMDAAGDIPLKMISYGASRRSIALLTDTRYRTRLLRNLNDKLFGTYVERQDKETAWGV